MVQTIVADTLTLYNLSQQFSFQLTNDPFFFPEWQGDLPQLTDTEQQRLERVRAIAPVHLRTGQRPGASVADLEATGGDRGSNRFRRSLVKTSEVCVQQIPNFRQIAGMRLAQYIKGTSKQSGVLPHGIAHRTGNWFSPQD